MIVYQLFHLNHETFGIQLPSTMIKVGTLEMNDLGVVVGEGTREEAWVHYCAAISAS